MAGLTNNLTIKEDDINITINEETMSSIIITFAMVSAVIILAVNIPIITSFSKVRNYTFINNLVLLDCVDSLAHIPCLVHSILFYFIIIYYIQQVVWRST